MRRTTSTRTVQRQPQQSQIAQDQRLRSQVSFPQCLSSIPSSVVSSSLDFLRLCQCPLSTLSWAVSSMGFLRLLRSDSFVYFLEFSQTGLLASAAPSLEFSRLLPFALVASSTELSQRSLLVSGGSSVPRRKSVSSRSSGFKHGHGLNSPEKCGNCALKMLSDDLRNRSRGHHLGLPSANRSRSCGQRHGSPNASHACLQPREWRTL